MICTLDVPKGPCQVSNGPGIGISLYDVNNQEHLSASEIKTSNHLFVKNRDNFIQ